MNTRSHSAYTRTPPVQEHTPIYDLNAYHQRKRQLQRKHIIKIAIDTTAFFSTVLFTASMLYWGM